MSSVVIELQRDALDRAVQVSDLLRKALVVARKLGLTEFHAWIDKELKGYSREDDVPEYRDVSGQIRAWNPYRGWIPVIINDVSLAELLSRRKCAQSIAELEHLVRDGKDDGVLHMPFPEETRRRLSHAMGFDTEVSLFTQRAALVGIVDAVRTVILNWALKLEEDGILGEGLSFTLKEREAAGRSAQNVTNFYGPVQSPQIQQGSAQPTQLAVNLSLNLGAVHAFVDLFKQNLGSLDLPDEPRQETEAELHTLESQIHSPKPKSSIIREGLSSLRRILEGAGGGAVAQLLLRELAKLID